MQTRLNKYLSNRGILSRRKTDKLIEEGKITVNGNRADLGTQIDPNVDVIEIEGNRIEGVPTEFVYIMLNKPLDVLSTTTDDRGRKTVLDLVPKDYGYLYPVGRLDYNSTGLILLTNDGDLAVKITHPRNHVPKTYVVSTDKVLSQGQIEALRTGVMIDNERTHPAKVDKINQTTFKIVLHQGRKRQIREMCKKINLKVQSLKRIQIGNLSLGSLKEGEFRLLSSSEIADLKKLAVPAGLSSLITV